MIKYPSNGNFQPILTSDRGDGALLEVGVLIEVLRYIIFICKMVNYISTI
jgi:hypothetical protein